jgi:hypothetical protein
LDVTDPVGEPGAVRAKAERSAEREAVVAPAEAFIQEIRVNWGAKTHAEYL